MVLSDDALQLARHRPPIELATGWSCLPYLFGVAIYCFEARNPLEWSYCGFPPSMQALGLQRT